MSPLTYPEAVVVGLIQGATELFPMSSLGHSVLIPALVGGRWAYDLNVSRPESPYLAFVVGLHVATAIAMIIYFWRDWVRIIRAFFVSLGRRRIETADEKLAWMIVVATIPVGIAGLALEHLFRVVFSKPIPTALFLAVNGLILLAGERLRRREAARPAAAAVRPAGTGAPGRPEYQAPYGGQAGYEQAEYEEAEYEEAEYGRARARSATGAGYGPAVSPPGTAYAGAGGAPARHTAGQRALREQESAVAAESDRRLSLLGFVQAFILGAVQILALLPGISRDGVVMVGGMFRGLSRHDAARFSFLLSAPVIFAAGMLKVPDLMGPLGNGIRGQILVGSILSGVGAYLALRLFMRWLEKSTRTLAPFAMYCLIVGLGSAIYLSVR